MISTMHKKFVGRINNINSTRKKCEKLYEKHFINRDDIYLYYSGLYIEMITSVELYIERIFINLLCQNYVLRSSKCKPKLLVKSNRQARDIVLAGNKYIDWLPYDKTLKLADIYFQKGRPFSLVSKQDVRFLDFALCVRHSIAHKSKHSEKRLKQELEQRFVYLTDKEKHSIPFLRSMYSHSPATTYYEYIMSNVIRVVGGIST